ncbi:hypothetical protein BC828DRAFT_291830 [Blastocladiella britannica]|nr:hypothetical protein BC828DRAFT_291830 [Blastocladiella britannica]
MSNSPIDGGIVGAASPVPSAGGYNNTKPLKWPLLNLRDCYTDPPTHRRTLDEAEAAFWRYEAMLRSVSKSGRAHLESIRVLVEKHRLFSEDLLRTSRVLSDGDAEWDSFQNRLTDELESYRSMYTHYAELTNNVVLASLDKLVADTAPGIKDARKRFNQASEAADAALDKYLDRKAGDGAIPKSAKEVAAARKTFHEAALTFATRLNAAAAARKPELMTRTFEWLGISVSLHSQTIGLLNQLMKPRVEQFQTAAGRASADAQSQMAKAEALRAKLLLNADNSYDPLQKGMFDAFKGPSPPTKSASPALRASSPADTHESDDWDVVDRPPDEQVFRAGYLLKKNQGQRMRVTTWSRRYFTIRGELLVYQSRDKEEEPTVAVNLRLSTVKACEPAAGERRFAFQIISSSKQYTLQAESEEDMSAWIDALQKAIGGALFATSPDVPMLGVGNGKHKHKLSGSVSGSIAAGGSALSASSGNGTMEVSPAILEANRATANHRARVAEILATAGNVVCGDCGQSDPEWAAINLGVVLCIECSGIHRGFGTAVSKTRSLILDKWDDEIVGIMCALGNDAVNAVYLHRQAGVIGIEPSVDRATREAYLRKKYVAREWVDRDHVLAPLTSAQSAVDGGGPPSTHEAFWDAIRAGALPRALALLAVGAVVDWQHPTHAYRTALHEAIRAGNNVAAEFLLQWGASPSAADRDGWTPVHYAASAANSSMIYRLVGRAGAPHDAKDVRGQVHANFFSLF